MKKVVKISIIAGVSLAIIGTVSYFVRKKIRKNQLDKPCKGKSCAEDINGQNLYIAKDYVNVRDSAEVNNKELPFDWVDNLIGEVSTNPIGTVISQVTGADGLNWYKVKLAQPLEGEEVGYVREDVITTKK